MEVNQPALWLDAFPWPATDVHKYLRGSVLAVSGPVLAGGAIRLAARAALRVGAGLVTIVGDREALKEHAAHCDAIMLREADAYGLGRRLDDERVSACIIGPGLGLEGRPRRLVDTAVRSRVRLVLDADALTILAEDLAAVHERPAETVLTPHAGEFGRLFPDLPATDPTSAKEAADRLGCVVVLKGPATVVAAPDGRASQANNGTPFLATAGSGDVLAGIVGGFLGQGMPSYDAACAAVWIHAEVGRTFGPGLIAEDLPEALPSVLRRLFDRHSE